MYRLYRELDLNISKADCWDFFSTPRNLSVITPDFMSFEFVSGADQAMHPGQLIEYRVRPLGPIPIKWITEITQVVENELFVDEQRFGPYKFWHHKHRFVELENGMRCIDELHYLPPGYFMSPLINCMFVRSKLEQIFDYRTKVLIDRFGKC